MTLNTTYRRKQISSIVIMAGSRRKTKSLFVCVSVCVCVYVCLHVCVSACPLFVRSGCLCDVNCAHPVTCLCTCLLTLTQIDTGTSHQPPCPPTLILAKPATHPARAQRHLATAQSQPQLLPLTFSLTTQSIVYTLIHNFPIVTTTHWFTSGATRAAVTSLVKPRHKI